MNMKSTILSGVLGAGLTAPAYAEDYSSLESVPGQYTVVMVPEGTKLWNVASEFVLGDDNLANGIQKTTLCDPYETKRRVSNANNDIARLTARVAAEVGLTALVTAMQDDSVMVKLKDGSTCEANPKYETVLTKDGLYGDGFAGLVGQSGLVPVVIPVKYADSVVVIASAPIVVEAPVVPIVEDPVAPIVEAPSQWFPLGWNVEDLTDRQIGLSGGYSGKTMQLQYMNSEQGIQKQRDTENAPFLGLHAQIPLVDFWNQKDDSSLVLGLVGDAQFDFIKGTLRGNAQKYSLAGTFGVATESASGTVGLGVSHYNRETSSTDEDVYAEVTQRGTGFMALADFRLGKLLFDGKYLKYSSLDVLVDGEVSVGEEKYPFSANAQSDVSSFTVTGGYVFPVAEGKIDLIPAVSYSHTGNIITGDANVPDSWNSQNSLTLAPRTRLYLGKQFVLDAGLDWNVFDTFDYSEYSILAIGTQENIAVQAGLTYRPGVK